MTSFNDKVSNLLEYIGIHSKSYSHTLSVCTYDPEDVMPYYLDQSRRANYAGLTDQTGIPLYDLGMGPEYFPTFIGLHALGHLELYRQYNQEENLRAAINTANWFVDTQNGKGAWLTHTDFKRYGMLAPWPSAMAQGLAISSLMRVYSITDQAKYLETSCRALIPFHLPVEKGGVISYEDSYIFYDEYPSKGKWHVLNGFIFALWGLCDLYRIADNHEAEELFADGLKTLRHYLPKFDIGYWSLYHIGKGLRNPATIPYHRLHINQMEAMYKLTGEELFRKYHNLWQKYNEKRFNALLSLPLKLAYLAVSRFS